MRGALRVAAAALSMLVCAGAGSAHAQAGDGPIAERDVPEPLKPWVGWVLDGTEASRCPFFQGDASRRACAWPASLTLELDDRGGRFTQEWRIHAPTWAPLPGEPKRWPLDVRTDGASAAVVEREGRPAVRLEPGTARVTGTFSWDRLPELLQVPRETGIVSLTLRGRRVEFPSRDQEGRLWLTREQAAEEGESRLEVAVHRKVTDAIPLELTTDVTLKVSGRNREVVLARALPEGFVPMSLTGPLPARVEPDGRLRVQVRPGTWRLLLEARHEGPAAQITLPPLAEGAGAWDADEAWVFEARPQLRVVSVEGVPAVDAQQTELPEAWRSLPAYLVKPGDTMRFAERRRGDSDPAPDRLSLDRTWWLDFDGGGFTVQDRVGGTLSRSWRLEMGNETALGRVAIDGRDQFITERDDRRGIEVRQSNVSLEADSRLDGRITNVPAVGWMHDFESVRARLHLPPGWRLVHAFGVDRAAPTWLGEWDLLDLFLLLVISLSIGRLWGAGWGAFALATLGLSWHEPGATRWVWLFLLVGEALWRVLPAGIFKSGFRVYRWLVWTVLVLLTVPFLATQVRNAMYPQLEPRSPRGWTAGMFDDGDFGAGSPSPAVAFEPAAPTPTPGFGAEETLAKDEMDRASAYRSQPSRQKAPASLENLYAPDPKSQVSTGPGLPSWTWREVSLSWRGPVDAEQRIRFLLVPPWLHLLVSFVRAVLSATLVLLVIGAPVGRWLSRRGTIAGSGGAASILAALLLVAPSVASAQVPPPEMLEELKRRMLQAPACAPRCADAGRMRVEASGSTLRIRMEISAAAETAVPLPGGAQQWSPSVVTVDGVAARGLRRTPDGVLWVPLSEGSHQIVLEGPLPERESVQVPLPMRPRHVSATASGWIVDGIHEDGQADETLQLTRTRAGGAASRDDLQQESLPPFLRVERSLRFDLSWQVQTRVVRLTPPGAAVVVEVPLLPGESVTSADVRVQNGRVAVGMGPTVTQTQWTSVLREASTIELVAPADVAWVEQWLVDASPIWHVDATGIPPVHRSGTPRLREWRPWPGESVKLEITRPEGAPGQTLTLDGVTLRLDPGLRATDATLSLSLRSSRGGQHAITLPEGAELQSVTIDSQTQPVRQEGRTVTLPVTPGRHTAQLVWREPKGVSVALRTPEVDLGAPAVNATLQVNMPAERWTLFTRGPLLGPAVLFWPLLLVYLAISFGLERLRLTPLRWWQWFLLALGLTQVAIPVAAFVAFWLLALGVRRERPPANPMAFDLFQIALPFLTLIAFGCLFASIVEGLLGAPEMQIRGNGSGATFLQWFADRTAAELPRASVYSVPRMVYRLAMLAWSLWLAASLLGWLRWAWGAFTTGGLWKALPSAPPRPKGPTPPAAPAAGDR